MADLLKAEEAEMAEQAADQAEEEEAEDGAEQAAEQLVLGAREWVVRRMQRTCMQKRAPYTVNSGIRERDVPLFRRPPTPNQLSRARSFVVASAPIEVSMRQSIPQQQPGTDRHPVCPMQSPPSQGRLRPCGGEGAS